jgi:hypothetical protein
MGQQYSLPRLHAQVRHLSPNAGQLHYGGDVSVFIGHNHAAAFAKAMGMDLAARVLL